jgi:hypothetical protein
MGMLPPASFSSGTALTNRAAAKNAGTVATIDAVCRRDATGVTRNLLLIPAMFVVLSPTTLLQTALPHAAQQMRVAAEINTMGVALS